MAKYGMEPGWMAVEGTYLFSQMHKYIGVENSADCFSLDNIGENGKNLTIAVLSMNRASLTIRLMHSIKEFIPNFAGEFLIGDNGSTECELKKLKFAIVNAPFKSRIVEFGKNYGVAGGRNRLYAQAHTDWIMSLDNDLYFTSNPLEQIAKDIAVLGTHFLALPLLDKGDSNSGLYGAHLYLEAKGGRPAIGLGTAYVVDRSRANIPADGFLCSAIPGTAAVLNKATFFQAGGYDDGMFVGFEDTEFSVRLFQKGYKMGSCGMISLEHDHPKADISADVDYEKVRFSRAKLFEAAMYFERKHGFFVWSDDVADWVEMRQEKTFGKEEDIKQTLKKRSKICIVIDRTNWALDHVADQIIKNLSDEFDFMRIYGTDIDNFADVLLLAEKCDIVHVMWRGHLASFNGDYCQTRIQNLGMTREEFMQKYVNNKVISTEIYDHLLLEGPESDFTPKLFTDADSIVTNYAVSSKKLWDIYQELPTIRIRPQAICQDGVDLDVFRPQNLERLKTAAQRTVRLGWVGNSKWIVNDLKGINTIIRPAIKELQAEGFNVELITSDRQDEMIPFEEMPNFYAGIDCYLCASSCEGTPNPVLESMACGIPVITTDVGLVPEVFGKEQMRFVLEERSVESMKEKIKMLIAENAFEKLSQENIVSIKSWDWKYMTENFRCYFRKCIEEIEEKKESAV